MAWPGTNGARRGLGKTGGKGGTGRPLLLRPECRHPARQENHGCGEKSNHRLEGGGQGDNLPVQCSFRVLVSGRCVVPGGVKGGERLPKGWCK